MAEHGNNNAGGHPDMDYAEHERVYQGFLRFTEIGAVACAALVVALAVGGVRHAWGTAVFGVILTLVASTIAIAAPRIGWRAPAVPLVLMLLALAFFQTAH